MSWLSRSILYASRSLTAIPDCEVSIQVLRHMTAVLGDPSRSRNRKSAMPPLMTKASFTGHVDILLKSEDRATGLEKTRVSELDCRQDGIAGDCHSGLARKSDSRTLQQYPRNTDIRNVRQLTLLSSEELAEVAVHMGVPQILPEWVGANVVTSGIPDLTLLPPSTRLQFPSGCTIVVDMENAPCRQVADVISGTHPDTVMGFVKAAAHKRGVTAWVERDGIIRQGDPIVLWFPPQRLYPHS